GTATSTGDTTNPGTATSTGDTTNPGTATSTVDSIRGVVASPGLAVGVAVQLVRPEIAVIEAGDGVAVEAVRLENAMAAVRARLQSHIAAERGPRRDILTAHLEFLDDPELTAAARSQVERGKSAGFAWRQAVRASVEVLRALPDARMAERADDLLDLESQMLAALNGSVTGAEYSLPDHAIVLANELLPSQFVALDPSRLAGICTSGGGPTSHVAILAAALNVPMLVAAGPRIGAIPNGSPLVLDAEQGTLQIAPTKPQLAIAEGMVTRRRARRAQEREAAQDECRTADGTRIEVFANVGSAIEARTGVSQGAEGCGLLRTEFLFLDRESAPDEATQTAAYQKIVDAFAGRPVVIRTLDVGGDKPLAYMPLSHEENPALGVRGIRVSLLHPEMLAVQLRAILRVLPRGRCRILLPMISDADEILAVRELLDAARREVGHNEPVLLGAMIETPASAMLADQIARTVDFLSIGTNDLTQYALAIDRGNPALASRIDGLHPAVLRLIANAARAARGNERDIAVCGGLASDPAAAAILIGLGVNELSTVPSAVPSVKALIRSLSLERCRDLAARALDAQSAAQVRSLVAQWPTKIKALTL
ncbi:MAG: phosphoenolpyruvate--protein phosphotransferase, partial [Gammaproteobacteria bacterium]